MGYQEQRVQGMNISDIAIDFEPMQDDELEMLEALTAEPTEAEQQLMAEQQSAFDKQFNDIFGGIA